MSALPDDADPASAEATEALQHNGAVTQATRKRRPVHGTPPHHDGSGPDNEATMYGDPASAEATVADKAEEAAPASEEAAPAPAAGKGSPSL